MKELNIRRGLPADVPEIVRLLNAAYRGSSSRRGWTTEADLIGGDVRTDEQDVTRVMAMSGSVFLLGVDPSGRIFGCVNLQLREATVYLGMFAVDPEKQGGGLGGRLMSEAEKWILQAGRSKIVMWVISLRSELIQWYLRIGFRDTGERREFREDGLSGHHLRPLEFMVMEKEIAAH
jgi:ribosomal protein S18 acetylase RimI-like enzyme